MYFDKNGKLLHRKAGSRRARTPGEFRRIVTICTLRNNRVMVLDRDGRISIWDAEGEHIRTFARPANRVYSACDLDGRIVMSERLEPQPGAALDSLTSYFSIAIGDSLRTPMGMHTEERLDVSPILRVRE